MGKCAFTRNWEEKEVSCNSFHVYSSQVRLSSLWTPKYFFSVIDVSLIAHKEWDDWCLLSFLSTPWGSKQKICHRRKTTTLLESISGLPFLSLSLFLYAPPFILTWRNIFSLSSKNKAIFTHPKPFHLDTLKDFLSIFQIFL